MIFYFNIACIVMAILYFIVGKNEQSTTWVVGSVIISAMAVLARHK